MKLNSRLALVLVFLLGIMTFPAGADFTDTSRGGEPVAPAPAVDDASPTTPVTDPARVAERYREVLARPVFKETVEPDFRSRIGEWISQWFTRLIVRFYQLQYVGNMPTFASLLMTVLSFLSVAGLLYIMIRLTRRKVRMEAELPGWVPGARTFRPPESYESEIQAAIGAGDWHGAWLAAWRQFLSRLEDRRLVESDRTRTNREYLAQLRDQPLPSPALALVTGMVDTYDRFIYGRQNIAETDWNHFYRQIDEAVLLLHLNDKVAAGLQSEGA